MTTATITSPGKKLAPGRKSIQGTGKSPVLQVVVSPQQKAKVMRLGGAKWIRNTINNTIE